EDGRSPPNQRARIADYWIVNLNDRVLEVRREPTRPGPAWRHGATLRSSRSGRLVAAAPMVCDERVRSYRRTLAIKASFHLRVALSKMPPSPRERQFAQREIARQIR